MRFAPCESTVRVFYSRFHSRFAPGFTPDSRSNSISLNHSVACRKRWCDREIGSLCHTPSSSIALSLGGSSKLRVAGSIPAGRTNHVNDFHILLKLNISIWCAGGAYKCWGTVRADSHWCRYSQKQGVNYKAN
jgi:hypothetical protein